MTFKTIETHAPWLTGGLVGLILLGVILSDKAKITDPQLIKNSGRLFSGVASVSGVIVGFLSTSLSLLFAISDRGYMRVLARSGAVSDLVSYLGWSIAHWLLLTFVCLAGSFVYDTISILKINLWGAFSISVAVMSIASFIRATRLVMSLLHKNMDPSRYRSD